MTTIWIVLLVLGILAVVGAAAFVVVRYVVRRAAATSSGAVDARFAPGEAVLTDPMANYFGRASRGGMEVRGNGALVLTDKALWFHRIGADAPLEIPLASITSVDTTRSHAGKTIGRDLLRVSFDDDSVAWYVRDLAGWLAAVDGRARS